MQLIFFLIGLSIKSFKKVFMRYFIICRIIIYCTAIVPNALDKIYHSIKY